MSRSRDSKDSSNKKKEKESNMPRDKEEWLKMLKENKNKQKENYKKIIKEIYNVKNKWKKQLKGQRRKKDYNSKEEKMLWLFPITHRSNQINNMVVKSKLEFKMIVPLQWHPP